jgi:hypothetical protein
VTIAGADDADALEVMRRYKISVCRDEEQEAGGNFDESRPAVCVAYRPDDRFGDDEDEPDYGAVGHAGAGGTDSATASGGEAAGVNDE